MSAPPINDDNPPNVGGAGDWRQSIAQSFRSEEIRSIANVLASLEPGATSASKLMLANKFEDKKWQYQDAEALLKKFIKTSKAKINTEKFVKT